MNWTTLNDTLRGADEKICRQLLAAELRGPRRAQFVRRIHSRINKVRADRERVELLRRLG